MVLGGLGVQLGLQLAGQLAVVQLELQGADVLSADGGLQVALQLLPPLRAPTSQCGPLGQP